MQDHEPCSERAVQNETKKAMSIDKNTFAKKSAESRKKHYEIVRSIEEYRAMLGDLEKIANGDYSNPQKTIPGELVSLSHHFILNGLLNQLNAIAEGVRRADMYLQKD